MLRQTLQLLVVVAGVAFATAVPAQEWNVRGGAQRDHEVIKRYRQLLLKNPDHGIAYRSLLAKLGQGPALDPLIDDVRGIAERGQEAEPYVLLGHLERDRGRASASLAAYQTAVRLEPDNAATHAALGSALDRAGRMVGANASFERALELTSTKAARQRLLRKLCDNALSRSDYPRAVEWMVAIVDLTPTDYGLRVELAELQLRAHQFDAALKTFEAALDRAGRNGKRRAQTLVDMGNVHRRMHDHVSAEDAYRRALKLIGKSNWMRREVLMRLLDVARDTGTLAKMYDELRREWSHPSYHDVMVLAGVSEELRRDGETVKWLERAMRLDRRAIEPRTRLIARLDHKKDAARVKKLYAEIVALRPDDLHQRLERIEWLFLRAGRAEEAMTALTALEKEVTGDPTSLVAIANSYVAFGLPDAAVRIHEDLQNSSPDHLVHLEAYGELLTRLGRTSDAEVVWQHLFAVDTDEVGARLRVAEIAARQKQFDRSIELLTWVVEHYPRLVNARQRLAGVYEATKRWPDALAQWETLFFEYDVDHAKRRVLAIAQRTAFIGDDALSPDDRLLARWEARYQQDESVRTAAVLVQLRSVLGDDVGARVLAEKLVELDPNGLPMSQHAAWVEVAHFVVKHADDPRDAIATLGRIADAFGDRRASSWRKALDIAVRSGVDVDAVLARALEAAPNDAYVQATAGAITTNAGEYDRAIEHYRRAIALGTKSFDVHFDLALLLKDQDRLDEAREIYHTVMQIDWSGDWARSAAFSAADLCETDAHRRALAAQLDGQRGRLSEQDFFAIVVAVYRELFLYADDPAALFESLGREALPRLVAAVQATELSDRQHAVKLVELYPPELVSSAILRAWPADGKMWNEAMVRIAALNGSPTLHTALLAAFDSVDLDAQETALFAAGYLRLSRASPRLIAILADVDRVTDEVMLAAGVLGRLGTPAAIERLAELSRAGDPDLRKLGVWALGQGDSPRAISLVAGHLHPISNTGALAGTLLNGAGDEGLRELLGAAWSADPSRRAVARGGLRSNTHFDVWATFPSAGDDWNWRPHRRIESAIVAAQRPANGAIAESFLGREDVVVEVTKKHLPTAGAVVLADLLEAADEVEQTDNVELAPSLRRVVRGLRPDLRLVVSRASAETLASALMLLPLAERASDVELIASAATRLPERDAARALERLSKYPWKSTRKALLTGMRDPEVSRRAAAIRAIARSEAADDKEVTELIASLAEDPAPQVQVAAIEALGQLRQSDAVEMLTNLHDSSEPTVQQAIRRALRQLPGEQARDAVRRFEVRASLPVCAGDPNDLSDLLRDDCAGAVQISDF